MPEFNDAAEDVAQGFEGTAGDTPDAPETEAIAGPSGPTESLKEMALSTSPSPPLEQVESPWNPERGGPRRVMRAVQKAADTDGLPAGLELIIGIAEIYVSAQGGSSASSGGTSEGPVVEPQPGEHEP